MKKDEMNSFLKKIPRGVIYHKVTDSVRYFLASMLAPLHRKEKVIEFENIFASYCERKYCVAFPFARTAIYFVLKALDLPKGAEVILPPITIKGIVDVVVDLGLTPVYVDLDVETINFRLDQLREKLNPNVKVAIITPLFGLVPDVSAMVALLKANGVFVIEDFSQCLNGRYDNKRVGTFGDVGIYSASSIKTLDTLGGGLAITDDQVVHDRLRNAQAGLMPARRTALIKKAWVNLIRNVATSEPVFSFLTFPVLQLIRQRNPEAALKQTGHRDKGRLATLPLLWFCRYTSVQAQIGIEQIKGVIAQDAARVANVEFLKASCEIDDFPKTTQESRNVYWQLILPVSNALEAQAYFAKRGIDSATSSLELVCALKDYPNRADLQTAQRIYRNGIFIPCFPHLSQSDMRRIVMAVNGYFQERGHAKEG
ncbi:putative pilin glycosylation protein [Pandoraea terrigena]|uniref:Putative pilin glycosylation protein n=2 Tax=Pandoraea terrigena TaxID=2508292 RepID=A0A5E4XTA6_9BURK|nr:putative pilin glycosylation protein [Pandoraea terrigena]